MGSTAFSLSNQGTLVKNSTGTSTFGGALSNSGTHRVMSGTLVYTGAVNQTGGIMSLTSTTACLRASNAGSLISVSGGQLMGIGTVDANVNASGSAVIMGGDLGAGTTPGIMTITGAYNIQASTVTTAFRITPSGAYSQLVVNGTTTLGGAMSFNFERSSPTDPNSFYKPALGTSLPVLVSHSGFTANTDFSSFPGVPNTSWFGADAPTKYHHWAPMKNGNEYDISVPPPPPGS